MKKVRFGIIGVGNMGTNHARWIAGDKKTLALGALCDRNPEKKKLADELGVPFFTDAQEMYDSGLIDVVLIAVPHYWHAPLAIRAARKGIHVLCEKPLSSTVGDARIMIAECKKRKVVLGAMLQQRVRPIMRKMKELVAKGVIGEVFRVEMVCSNWFRTQKYYDSGAWRGTWDGEGGGVLINQAPHSLDLFQWIGMGLPKTILANIGTREHKIEVEDTANVLCDYGNGKVGYIYATTAEEPGMEKFMVIGDKGTLIAENNKLMLGKLKQPVSKHIYGSKSTMGGGPAEQTCTWKEVPFKDTKPNLHLEVCRAFAAHLTKGAPLVAAGDDATAELEISNAAYISGFKNKSASLPNDAAEMEALIAKLEKDRSTGRGGGERKKAKAELKKLLAAGK